MGTKRKYTLYMSNCIYYIYMDNTICSFSIHWVGCARVSFDRQLTYLQLTTGHISRIENSENSFQKMPSQSPTALHLSGLPPQSIWRVPSNESSDIKWKRLSIPSISEYKMLLCNPKWVQMWQTSATFVRQRQASSIYRDIYMYI